MTAMTCERFEAILPDYFESGLGDGAKVAADAHAKTCESCAKIVADINRITNEAAALPAMRPSRDLWAGIERRIAAPVISLARPAHRTAPLVAPRWLAAAAAALIVTTAGVTYLATSRVATIPAAQVAVVSPKVGTPGIDSHVVVPNAILPAATPFTEKTPINRAPAARTSSATLASNDSSGRNTPAATASLGLGQADATYAREIDLLEKMISSPKSGLDTATVQIVKKNLQIIDDAIAQSKAALTKDPASSLLYNQMTRAMSKKVELLRTMASLSSST